MTNTIVRSSIVQKVTYLWRQKLGRYRGRRTFEIQFKLHYLRSHQVIEFECDLLFAGFNVEHLIGKILWAYGFPPQSSVVLHKTSKGWGYIQFEDWHQGFLLKPAYHPVHPAHIERIFSGKISNEFFTLKTEKLVPQKAQAPS